MINIAELLKDCPRGMALDCTICDNVVFDSVRDDLNVIHCAVGDNGDIIYLDKYGRERHPWCTKCIIFPKGKTTWEEFQRPIKDGDVVVCVDYNDQNNEERITQMFVVKSASDINKDAYCYAGYDFEEKELYNEGTWGFDRLATDAEKKIIFNALQCDGYRWNDKTKKIEKVFIPKFKVGDTIAHKDNKKRPFTITEITNTSYRGGTRFEILIEQQDYFELVTDKFDINELKPFDKVLVRYPNPDCPSCDYINRWTIQFFERYDPSNIYHFVCLGNIEYQQCIPYEGNEHLLNTKNNCEEYYKSW